MATLTLSIPDDLYAEMKKYRFIKWSEVARRAIEEFLENLREIETMDTFKKLYPRKHELKKAEAWSKKVEELEWERMKSFTTQAY